jgi:hypothetical protein
MSGSGTGAAISRYAPLVRASASLLVLIACHPSATVENTTPMANLQSYRTVAIRVHTSAFASQGNAMLLENAVTAKLHQLCAFEKVGPATGTPADVVLDMNITLMGRGGGGFVSNPNQATIESLLVLTDGQDGELLGTVKIRGKSSGMIINNSAPENEAIDVVAKTVGEILQKSGCTGPRIAKVAPTPPTPPGLGSGSAAPPDESRRAEADAMNDAGKEKLYAADVPGALASFQQANSILPDARYEFNVCLALGAQEQWDAAITACKQARGMNPAPKLATKIDARLEQLQHRQ